MELELKFVKKINANKGAWVGLAYIVLIAIIIAFVFLAVTGVLGGILEGLKASLSRLFCIGC